MQKKLILFLFSLVMHLTLFGNTQVQKAEQLYNNKNYAAAITAFTVLANDTTTITRDPAYAASIYYNLGNCYYRTKDYAQAVCAYQQSLRLQPSDKDAAFNLQLAQSKLPDQFNEPDQMLFGIWARSIMLSLSASAWGYGAILLLIMTFACIYLFQKGSVIAVSKCAFSGGILFAIMCIVCLTFAYFESNNAFPQQQSVTMQATTAYDSPSATAKNLRDLHEGVILNIKLQQADGWQQVELPDGTEAWILNAKTYPLR